MSYHLLCEWRRKLSYNCELKHVPSRIHTEQQKLSSAHRAPTYTHCYGPFEADYYIGSISGRYASCRCACAVLCLCVPFMRWVDFMPVVWRQRRGRFVYFIWFFNTRMCVFVHILTAHRYDCPHSPPLSHPPTLISLSCTCSTRINYYLVAILLYASRLMINGLQTHRPRYRFLFPSTRQPSHTNVRQENISKTLSDR